MRTRLGLFLFKIVLVYTMSDYDEIEVLTIEQQIENLKSLNLIIEDEKAAYEFLNKISYYRLVKAYSGGLKNHGGTYNANITFEHITDLYYFNDQLRSLLLPFLERIEIAARCRIANHFCLKYGSFGYENKSSFDNDDKYYDVRKSIEDSINKAFEAPIIKHFRENHGMRVPLYALIEVFSFGTLANFYNALKKEDRKEISQLFGVQEHYLGSWLLSFASTRNMCAHYDRLYGKNISKRPTLYKEDKKRADNRSLYAVLLCMRHLFRKDPEWHLFVDTLDKMIVSHPYVDPSKLGLRDGWEYVLLDLDPDNIMAQMLKGISLS